MSPVLSVKDLHTAFGKTVIHSGLNFTLNEPGYIALIGGSGTGKSVLLKEIIGLIKPVKGEIRVLGQTPEYTFGEGLRENPVGVLFQQGALFSSLSVVENVEAPLREHTNLSAKERRQVARLKLGLAAFPLVSANKKPSELSGGMLKRAALARALALEPKLLLCDEPTSGLDPINARAFDSLMLTLSEALGITALVVTHDLGSVLNYANRIIALADGKILADGTISEVSKVENPWLNEYLNSG
jgi:phospholipid/cholesterol/gamma-HCH transport system ATP-binding protein